MDEFALIQRFFTRSAGEGIDLGIGDDAALVQVSPGHQLVVSADTFLEGVHFFSGTDPIAIGYKSLAINLSDMAAMGACARWFTLCLSLPYADPSWLQAFSLGLFRLADQHQVALIGGDTVKGPLNISIQILGEVPIGQAITRAGAQVGDEIWVSGELGMAAMAVAERYQQLTLLPADRVLCVDKLDYPAPRLALGVALRGIASAMLDISDGLVGDLGHIASQASLGAELNLNHFPPCFLSAHYPQWLSKQLAGGDDYELCFTVPPDRHAQILAISQQLQLPLYCIGRMVDIPGIRLSDGQRLSNNAFRHFS